MSRRVTLEGMMDELVSVLRDGGVIAWSAYASAEAAELVEGHRLALRGIMGLHQKNEGPSGMTDGTCDECGSLWPCPTYHVASGWDTEEDHPDGWCPHVGTMLGRSSGRDADGVQALRLGP